MRIKGNLTSLAVLFFICLAVRGVSQTLSASYLDSLDYEGLLTEFDRFEGNFDNQQIIAREYLERARLVNDTIKIARGFDRLARLFDPATNIIYADSIIRITSNSGNKTYPALAYIIKGFEYNKIGDIINSTKNLFRAYDLSIDKKNVPQQLFILHLLIVNQSKWGDKKKALALQRKRHAILMSPDYIESLKASMRSGANIDINQLLINDQILSYGNFFICFNNLKNRDSSEFYLEKLKSNINDYHWVGRSNFLEFVQEAEVELSYLKGDYSRTKYLARKVLIDDNNSLSADSKLNLFQLLGSSEYILGNRTVGIENLKKADSLIDTGEVLIEPKHRNIYLTFNSFSEESNDLEGQISSLNKIIKIDSLLAVYHTHFEPNLVREIDVSLLINKKEALIESLNEENLRSKKTNLWIGLILVFTCGLLAYYFYQQKVYKRRFKKLIKRVDNPVFEDEPKYSYELSSSIIGSILDKLKLFENSNGFLDHDLSLHSLANRFETNPNYLSRVINAKIGKNFSRYINDLRIDYAMKYLLSDPKMRKYTIKAIAEECGYKSGESFSKAFYKQNGIYPSYYIKQLEKNESGINSKS